MERNKFGMWWGGNGMEGGYVGRWMEGKEWRGGVERKGGEISWSKVGWV